jgi:hypothetical protein
MMGDLCSAASQVGPAAHACCVLAAAIIAAAGYTLSRRALTSRNRARLLS